MFVSNLTARAEADAITAKVDGGAGAGVARFYSGTAPAAQIQRCPGIRSWPSSP